MIDNFIQKHNLPSYRIKQFNLAYYQQFITDFDELSTWSKDLRVKLISELKFSSLKKIKKETSKDGGTIKALFELETGEHIETVLMKHQDGRNTVCVSCMIGCPVGCKFCATGQMKFKRGLKTNEIIDQVLYFGRLLKKENMKITNIVFMGMGEPLLNLENVLEAISIINDPEKIGLGKRRVLISTVGIIDSFKKLIESDYKGRLAVSLHASNQKIRDEIIPIAKDNPIPELLSLIDLYIKKGKKRVSLEYILIKDLNDSREDAEALIKLVKNKLIHINLIPLNPVPHSNYKRPDKNRIFQFSNILRQHKIEHSIRVTMGDDIQAACGQLAGKK